MQLMEEKLQNGHSLYMDNYYNSFHLTERLLDNKTYCTGTLRKVLKENSKDVVQRTLKKGENISRFWEGVHIGKWKDKRPVMTSPWNMKTKGYRLLISVAKSMKNLKLLPNTISLCQELTDAFYPCERKTLRWYLKLVIHTFQLLFINSHKMYNKYSGQPKITLYDYRTAVINNLLPEKNTEVAVPTGPSRARPSREVSHKISKITMKNSNGNLMRKMCRMCSKAWQTWSVL